jgi:hypothetical protein
MYLYASIMNPAKLFRYKSVPSSEKFADEETASNAESELGLLKRLRRTPTAVKEKKWYTKALWIANLVLLLASMFMFLTGLRWQLDINSKCFEVANFYS